MKTKTFERIISGKSRQIDVVFDDHDVAGFVAGVEGSRFAGDDETLDAETTQHAHWKRALHERVALVGVEAALKTNHRPTMHFAEDESTHVTLNRRLRKVRNVAVPQAAEKNVYGIGLVSKII